MSTGSPRNLICPPIPFSDTLRATKEPSMTGRPSNERSTHVDPTGGTPPTERPAGLRRADRQLRAGRLVHRAQVPQVLPDVVFAGGDSPGARREPHPGRPGVRLPAPPHDCDARLQAPGRPAHRLNRQPRPRRLTPASPRWAVRSHPYHRMLE